MMEKSRRLNSFDIVRFMAASAVIFSHSYALTGLIEPHVGNVSLGGFSVWIFFILSGFLISYSWKQYPRFGVYLAKRGLRILPGLFFAVSLTIIFMGLFSNLSYWDYLHNQQTISYLNNLLLINTQYSLSGVFTDNIYPSAVNGSLWTLSYEFLMYVALALFGIAGFLHKKKILSLFGALFVINILSVLYPSLLKFSIFYFDMRLVAQLGIMFTSGVLFQIFSNKIKFNITLGAMTITLMFIMCAVFPQYSALFGSTLLAYGVLCVCHLPTFSSFGKYGDFSYGLYIYSFPIQQTISYLTRTSSPIKMFILSFVISYIMGVASWFLIEKRFVNLKSKINLDQYPANNERVASLKSW
jgi:peptidoglycan/LPS O-acetylase OafA/YrhL